MIPRFLVNLNELAFIFGSLSFPPLSEIICPLSLKKSVISIDSKSFSISSGLDSTTTNSIGSGESIRRETNTYHIRIFYICDRFFSVGSWIMWFISRWEENNCCYKNSEDGTHFQSRWSKLPFWVKRFVILWVAQLVARVLFSQIEINHTVNLEYFNIKE